LADLFIVRVAPIDYSPILLLKPSGFRIAPNTLSSGKPREDGFRSILAVSGFRLRARLDFSIPSFSSRPARHYPRFWIQRPSFERRGDFNPPDSCAAQRTLCPLLTSALRSDRLSTASVAGATQSRSPGVSSAAFRAQSSDLRFAPLMDMDFAVSRPLVRRLRLVSAVPTAWIQADTAHPHAPLRSESCSGRVPWRSFRYQPRERIRANPGIGRNYANRHPASLGNGHVAPLPRPCSNHHVAEATPRLIHEGNAGSPHNTPFSVCGSVDHQYGWQLTQSKGFNACGPAQCTRYTSDRTVGA